MNNPKYSIVLPCYNEAGNIPLLVERFKRYSHRNDFELILVNNGSTDNSTDVLKKVKENSENYYIKTIEIEKNIGYGHGIHTGLKTAKGSILSYSHADIQTPPEDIFKAFELIETNKIDIQKTLIKGFRVNRSDDKTFLTKGLARVVSILLGVALEDINGQPKVFSRKFFQSLQRPPIDFSYDVFIMFSCARNKLILKTFNVDFGERVFGESKWASNILSRYKTIFKYLKSIFLISWYYKNEKDNPIGQLIRFLITGVFTNITNYSTFLILLHGITTHYMVASTSGFLAGLILGFIVNRNYTFNASTGKINRQITKFVVVNVVSLIANLITIRGVVDILRIIPEIGQIFAIAISTVINFLGSKLWAFKK